MWQGIKWSTPSALLRHPCDSHGWPCDEILTYRYVKPRVQWFPNEVEPPTDPFRIARGLEGYAHRARSRAPSSKET
jgi:hypothetical protein